MSEAMWECVKAMIEIHRLCTIGQEETAEYYRVNEGASDAWHKLTPLEQEQLGEMSLLLYRVSDLTRKNK